MSKTQKIILTALSVITIPLSMYFAINSTWVEKPEIVLVLQCCVWVYLVYNTILMWIQE
jgi:hypothetical protein